MILQGVIYMVLGMAVVFAFLFILVVVLRIASRITAYLDKRYPQREEGPAVPGRGTEAAEDHGEIAAILAAILAHDPEAVGALTVAAVEQVPIASASGVSPAARAVGPARAVNPWILSGRQASMRMRTLAQHGALKR